MGGHVTHPWYKIGNPGCIPRQMPEIADIYTALDRFHVNLIMATFSRSAPDKHNTLL